MSVKSYFQQHPAVFVLANIAIAFIIGLIILFATNSTLLNLTHHGEQVEVPDVSGLYVEEAQIILDAQNLKSLVIDSTYDKTKRLGTVIQQVPVAGSHVKQNREIYLSINAKQIRQVTIPDLRNFSYRQAKVQLEAMGINVDTTYTESEFRDLVIDMEYKGVPIADNTRLKEGEKVYLIIGKGKNIGDEKNVVVPNLIGLSLNVAKQTIRQQGMQLGGCIADGGVLDTINNTYWVYDQDPNPRVQSYLGATVSIYLSTDPDKADRHILFQQQEQEQRATEEDFF